MSYLFYFVMLYGVINQSATTFYSPVSNPLISQDICYFEMFYDYFLDDGMEEDEPPPPPKKTKKGKKSRILDSDKVSASAEVLGEILDNQPTGKSKQMEWEEKRTSNKQGKRFTKSKGTGKHPNKRFRKK